jgi:hypothetical protein
MTEEVKGKTIARHANCTAGLCLVADGAGLKRLRYRRSGGLVLVRDFPSRRNCAHRAASPGCGWAGVRAGRVGHFRSRRANS